MAENIRQLKNDSNIIVVNGVTYFKLISNFPGDRTKNCGLTGEEIDGNFYFLRGYDIKSVAMDEEKNLVITRVDPAYDPIVIPIGDEIGQPLFEYDPKEGVLTVIYPNGETETLDGFMVPGKDYKVATDASINGDGSIPNPLRLSNMEKTGTYAPAAEYLDMTEGAELPTDKGAGYRIVTKETVDDFGRLYPFDAIDILKERLEAESSPWRVPTKEDWDEMLNALECEENRNHANPQVGVYGEVAGQALKSNDELWAPFSEEVLGIDAVGFHAYPLGNCAQRNSMMDDPDYDAEGFRKFASFWADTVDDVENAYAKSVYYSTKKVKQETKGKEARLSIRLVKDYDYGNYSEYETILGANYKTTLIQSPFDDCDYVKVWTSQNLYDSTPELSGVTSDEWSAATGEIRQIKDVYFINEFDGYKWIKKLMKDGDSIVIVDYREGNEVIPYHEWRVINEDLVDTLAALKDEFKEELDEIKEDINNINTEISGITENLNELSASTTENVERLDNTINEFSASTVGEIERIDTELTRLDGNDVVPGEYTLSGDSDSEMEIPTKGEEVENLRVKVSDDFFDFGTF